MSGIFGPVLWFIIAIGILVSFHEFGHFWVARRLGVKVLRFSVGFGRPLWQRTGKDGTEYAVAALPLGGYVKMLDEREGDVAENERHMAFNRKPVWTRIAIVAAGPIFNLVLAVILMWIMYMVGIADVRAVLGETKGLAAEAGLHAEGIIVAVDERPVETWSDAFQALVIPALERRDVIVAQESAHGGISQHRLELSRLPEDFRELELLEFTGLSLWHLPRSAEISKVSDDSPAQRAGIQVGDRITRINGEAVNEWSDVTRIIGSQAEAGQPLEVEWLRSGDTLNAQIIPIREETEQRLIIGIAPVGPSEDALAQARSYQIVQHFGPVEALGRAVVHLGRLTNDTLSMLKQLVLGRASLDNLSGPITIAQLANDSAALGVARFLAFLGLISLSLGILNLLPIPMLDGGHLMYYFIELIKGSPVPDKIQLAGQYVGVVALASLMGLAIFNDILRLFA